MSRSSQLVYSTDQGRICPDCRQPKTACCCKTAAAPVSDGPIRIRRQTKGRKGKGVTLIEGIPLADDDLKALAKQLKKACGSGGTVKNGVIEIQGDYREQALAYLVKQGYEAKLAGG
ncbi:MAG: translation initiation factor Sui1 [Pseudomonadales bacterium]|jgi:translation initiation factor 1